MRTRSRVRPRTTTFYLPLYPLHLLSSTSNPRITLASRVRSHACRRLTPLGRKMGSSPHSRLAIYKHCPQENPDRSTADSKKSHKFLTAMNQNVSKLNVLKLTSVTLTATYHPYQLRELKWWLKLFSSALFTIASWLFGINFPHNWMRDGMSLLC